MLSPAPAGRRRLLAPGFCATVLVLAALAAGRPAAPGPTTVLAQSGPLSFTRSAVWPGGYDPDSLLDAGGVAAGRDGRFLLADTGHDRVLTVDRDGRVLAAFGRRGDGPDQLRTPRDLAVDLGRDRVYVVDGGNRRISIFRLDGSPVAQWRSGGPDFGFAPHAVAVAPASGEVYVLSRLPWGLIDRFSPDGAWLGGWGDTGSQPGQMEYPEDLALLPDGRVAVADTGNGRIQVFSAQGLPVLAQWSLAGVRRLDHDAQTDRLFALFASDPGGPLDRVARFAADGSRLADLPAPPAGEAIAPARGLALGGGRLAVTSGGDAGGRQGLRLLDPSSGLLLAGALGRPADHPAFLAAGALDVAPDGSLVVLDPPLGLLRRLASQDGRPVAILEQRSSEDLSVAADGAVYVASTPLQGGVNLRKLAPDGSPRWEKPCDCLSGLGLAADAGAVYATDAFRRQLTVFDQDPLRRDPVATLRPSEALPYGWLQDLDLGPDGTVWGLGGADRLVYRFAAGGGRLLGSWELASDQGGERISVAPDGTVFVLRADGRVAAFDAAGQALGLLTPEPAPGRRWARLRDIAAGPGGRLYASDAVSGAIFVYQSQAGVATPTATPPSSPPCTVSGDKRASPGQLALGEQVELTLSLDIVCRPGSERQADILLVLDRSSSMSGLKLDSARAAALRFVTQLDLRRHRIGLVSFSDLVSLDQPLTSDGAALRAVLGSIRSDGSTDIGAALERAQEHLAEAGRPGAMPVLLLMTDGKPTREGQPYIDALRGAARARGRGALIYTIGLGDDVVRPLLEAIAGSADRYFFAPSSEQLAPIYNQLSGTVGEVVATDLVLTDGLGPDMRLVAGSIQPPPAEQDASSVTWRMPALPAGGLAFRLKVEPLRLGRLPTNSRATAAYTADGQRYSFEFPVPEVLVLGPPTATPEPRPGRVYLPLVLREACLVKRQVGVDLVLALDSSSSMEGAKLAAAVAAARALLDELEPRTDRVGLVTFDGVARRDYVITQDFAAISRRLDQIVLGTGTRIDLGLERSLAELEVRGRAGSRRAVVLLSDGRPSEGTEARALELAALARDSDVSVFTVGLGDDADGTLLSRLAKDPSYAYLAPDAAELAAIYRRIAVTLPCR